MRKNKTWQELQDYLREFDIDADRLRGIHNPGLRSVARVVIFEVSELCAGALQRWQLRFYIPLNLVGLALVVLLAIKLEALALPGVLILLLADLYLISALRIPALRELIKLRPQQLAGFESYLFSVCFSELHAAPALRANTWRQLMSMEKAKHPATVKIIELYRRDCQRGFDIRPGMHGLPQADYPEPGIASTIAARLVLLRMLSDLLHREEFMRSNA